jgi:bifunctional enzyme CysN/CysC
MDLVGYSDSIFERIVADYAEFARAAGIEEFTAIPVSGLAGDNITARSSTMPWYEGPSLLDHLETVPPADRRTVNEPFRMAVQWVNRPSQNFRGFAGRIASGRIRQGDAVAILPAGRTTFVERIVTFDGDLDSAAEGQSVTLTFTDEIDCSRGDLIVSADEAPEPANRILASLVWLSDEKLVPHRSYWLKVGTQTVSASVDLVRSIIDVNTLAERSGEPLGLNDIGKVEIDLDRSIPAVRYARNRKLGGFILIDKISHATIAAGLVEDLQESGVSTRPTHSSFETIAWVTGSERTAWAARAAARLKAQGRPVILIGEAAVAAFPGNDPVSAAREVARLAAGAGVAVLITIDAPPGESCPGRVIDSSTEELGGEEWVI